MRVSVDLMASIDGSRFAGFRFETRAGRSSAGTSLLTDIDDLKRAEAELGA